MNSVELIGRATRDPQVRYTSEQMCVVSFNIAVDRPKRKDAEKQTDFPHVVVYGKQAETCEKYVKQGKLVSVQGSIQTGSYTNRNGDTVYTTDVVANRIEFLDWGNNNKPQQEDAKQEEPKPVHQQTFEEINDDCPF